MNIQKYIKPSFEVIGKEGTTDDGVGFFKDLWHEATDNFNEVEQYAVKDDNGKVIGAWGIMSDKSRSFKPWENNFTEGLYLAGIECVKGAEAPEGWTKWYVPGAEYIYVENEGPDTFPNVINYMRDNNITLAGAVYDYSDFQNGKDYMFFPVKRI